jgi:hypothetical protein
MPQEISFSFTHEGTRHFASADGGPRYYLGQDMKYLSRRGLGLRVQDYWGQRFSAADHLSELGLWAHLLEASGACESRNHLNCINAYDRAAFTFGFYQLAAHTPNDNLVLLFRSLLQLPDAERYYPELTLQDNRVHRRREDGTLQNLEQSGPTESGDSENGRFMAYLNGDPSKVDDRELLHAARLMHWMENDAAARRAQVEVSAAILQRKMKTYAKWYALDGKQDLLCLAIADIHHQGRAKKSAVAKALTGADPIDALVNINQNYIERNKALGREIKRLRDAGLLGQFRYRAATHDFG